MLIYMSATSGGRAMWGVIKSILWAFLGVQRDQQRREEFESGKPMAFILTGLVMGVLLVLVLVFLAVRIAG